MFIRHVHVWAVVVCLSALPVDLCLAQIQLNPGDIFVAESPNYQNYFNDDFIVDDGEIHCVATGVTGPRTIFNGTFLLNGDATFTGFPSASGSGYHSIYIDFYNDITGVGGLTLQGDMSTPYSSRYRAQYRFYGGSNSFAGPTTVRNATASFEIAGALGNGTQLLTLDNAEAAFYYDLTNPIYATNYSGIALAGLNNSSSITLNGSRVWSGVSTGDITLSSAVTLQGGGSISADGQSFHITGGVIGNGTLFVYSNSGCVLQFDSVIGHNGGLRVTGGDVSLNATNTFPAAVQIEGGTLHINADNTFSRLRLARGSGQLHVVAGNTLTVTEDSTIRFEGGKLNIEGTVAGVDMYELIGMNEATLTNLGVGSTAELRVQRGWAKIYDNSLGSDSGIVSVQGHTFAVAATEAGANLTRDVYLNNSLGYEYNGGLYAEGGGASEVSGDIYLGDVGSIIGSGDVLTVSGAIHGNNLTVRGVGGSGNNVNTVRITGNAHTYTGKTNVLRGKLLLIDNGSLQSTSSIEVGLGGYDPHMVIDNTGSANLTDRIGDDIPIGLHDAEFTFIGNGTTTTSEQLGNVSIKTGLNRFSVQKTTVTLNQLQQAGHGSVIFTDLPDTGGTGKLLINNAPTLDHGIIGPWAVIQSGTTDRLSFATYDPVDGIKGITNYISDLNTATEADHVSTNFVNTYTLAADTTIASLRLREGSGANSAHTLNLDGHTLNIATGGLIKDDGAHSYISNGTLTAGGTGDGEIVIFDRGVSGTKYFDLSADIADNASGGVVSLTKSGYARTTLSGVLSYSGATTINHGILDVNSPGCLPVGTDLNVHGGELWVNEGTQDAVVSLGVVSVTNNGKLWGGSNGPLLFDAEQWQMQSGWIDARLAGDGTMTKTTLGQAKISGSNTNYNGNIDIVEGMLYAEGTDVLGNGVTSVYSNARLQISGSNANGHITLRGGELTGSRTTYAGLINVAEDSAIYTLANDFILSGSISGNAGLTLGGVATYSLRLQGDNSDYHGQIDAVGGTIRPEHQFALGDGDVYVHDAATLRFFNDLTFGTIHTDNGTIEANNYQAISVNGTLDLHGVTDFRVGDSYDLTLTGTVILGDNVQVNKFGHDHSLNFDGTMLVGAGTEIYVNEGHMRVTGLIRTNATNASLNLVRGNAIDLDADVEIQDGHTLSLTVDQELGDLLIDAPGQALFGSGQINANLMLSNGAELQPGNSPGTLTVTHDTTLGSGGVYEWQINDAEGAPGQADGWDLFVVGNELRIDATTDAPFVIRLLSLNGSNDPGALANFDPSHSYTWLIAQSDQLSIDALELDTSAFTAYNTTAPAAKFGWLSDGAQLYITYTIPEPATALFLLSLLAVRQLSRTTSTAIRSRGKVL